MIIIILKKKIKTKTLFCKLSIASTTYMHGWSHLVTWGDGTLKAQDGPWEKKKS
jgi:hypothetical protein